MLRKISKILSLLLDFKMLQFQLGVKFSGYLNEIGWIESFREMMPQNKKGAPIPWMTYSSISFIEPKLKKNMRIFEYGSGNSTLFYAEKVNYVIGVEHNKEWVEKLRELIPDNVKIEHEILEYAGNYCKKANSYVEKFDIIIIDGRDRVNCILESVHAISERGVIILDDSERIEYQEGKDFLVEKGFKYIEFWGIAPGIFFNKCTTIFYRKNNVLEI